MIVFGYTQQIKIMNIRFEKVMNEIVGLRIKVVSF